MISLHRSTQSSLTTDHRGRRAPLLSRLNKPLTFVFLVWGILFIAVGLLWFLLP